MRQEAKAVRDQALNEIEQMNKSLISQDIPLPINTIKKAFYIPDYDFFTPNKNKYNAKTAPNNKDRKIETAG